MNRQITNEKADIRYALQDNYYLPDLALPAEEEQPIGIWGQRHRRYLTEHHRILYYNLLTSCKLTATLPTLTGRRKNCFPGW